MTMGTRWSLIVGLPSACATLRLQVTIGADPSATVRLRYDPAVKGTGGVVERSAILPGSLQELWEAVTTPEGLSGWFGGEAVELEPWPGGRVVLNERGTVRRGVVQVVEAPRRFVFRWLPIEEGPDGDPRPVLGSTVELALEETREGTRLTVWERTSRSTTQDAQMMVAR
jgi:uncharacterized protein YndB with AHSA1/START domain